jgi:hypothetical protein
MVEDKDSFLNRYYYERRSGSGGREAAAGWSELEGKMRLKIVGGMDGWRRWKWKEGCNSLGRR